jgi:hypothetical protein
MRAATEGCPQLFPDYIDAAPLVFSKLESTVRGEWISEFLGFGNHIFTENGPEGDS